MTSEVGIYNGPSLEKIVYTPGVSVLNDILNSIDDVLKDIYNVKLEHIKSSKIDNYDGTANFIYYTFSGTLNNVLNTIGNGLDGLKSSMINLKTSEITWDAPAPINYVPDAMYVKTNKYFKGVDTKLGEILTTINGLPTLTNIYNEIKGISVSFVVSGATITNVLLVLTIATIDCYIDGKRFGINNTDKNLTALSDNYIDLKYDQTYLVSPVPIGDPAPPIAAGGVGIRLWKVRTDATTVTATTDLRNLYSISGSMLARNTIIADHLQNSIINEDKLSATGVGAGTYTFPAITVNSKGRISAASALAEITAPTNKQCFLYDTASGKWKNFDFIGNLLSIGNDGDILRYSVAQGIYEPVSPSIVLDQVEIKTSISSINVLQLNALPISVIPAPGAGKAIRLLYFSGRALWQGGDVAYSTNLDLVLITDTATTEQGYIGGANGLLTSTAARHIVGNIVTNLNATTNTQLIENKPLTAYVKTGNPLNGTFAIDLYIRYQIITL